MYDKEKAHERWERIFEDLRKAEQEDKELYLQEMNRYKEIARKYLEYADEDEVAELFEPSQYDSIRSIGYATVKEEDSKIKIDRIEYSKDGFDKRYPDIVWLPFYSHPFLKDENPSILFHEFEDAYSSCFDDNRHWGYMLFPVPDSDRYWVVRYVV